MESFTHSKPHSIFFLKYLQERSISEPCHGKQSVIWQNWRAFLMSRVCLQTTCHIEEGTLTMFLDATTIPRKIRISIFINSLTVTVKKKKELRNKWIHWISQKNFCPGPHHCVCSSHFPVGVITYMNYITTVVLKTIYPAESKPHQTVWSKLGLQ